MGHSVDHKLLIKMKVAVVFLACFVGASLQQAFYQPYPYGQPAFYLNPYAGYGQDRLVDSPNPQGRSNVAVEASDDEKSLAEEGGRLFFGNSVVFTLGGLGGFLGVTSTTTATALATTTTTATSASIVSCIPSNQFLSNTACRRRRAIFEDSGLEDHIAPSKKEEVEPSVMPVEEVKREEVEPEILSSHSETVDGSAVADHVIKKRFAFTSVITTTATTTITSVSFTSTTFTSTLNIGSTTSVLTCLPVGIVTC